MTDTREQIERESKQRAETSVFVNAAEIQEASTVPWGLEEIGTLLWSVKAETDIEAMRAKTLAAFDFLADHVLRTTPQTDHLTTILSLFDDAGMFISTLDQQIAAVKAAKRAVNGGAA